MPVLRLARPPDIAELLPAAVQLDANLAILLATRALEDERWFSLRPLPLGRWEFRTRDAAWLEREAAQLRER